MAPARERRQRKRGKERKGREDRPGAPSLPGPPAKRDPRWDGRAVAIRARRDPTADRRDTFPRTPHTGLAKAGSGAREAERGDGGARQGRAEGPPPSPGGKEERERSHAVVGRRRRPVTWWGGAGARERPRRPPHHATGRAGAGGCGRASGARPPRGDKPLCRGLTFNRSQRGSCSATYETPTQKQVVYEWFSARFHTNVR